MAKDEFNEESHPGIFSLEFHTRFFPSMLLGNLSNGSRSSTGFTSTLDHFIFLVVCILLMVIGLPLAVSNNSIIGWILGGIGTIGVIFIFVNSILSGIGRSPSYYTFLKGIFYFFMCLGISAGIFIGTLEQSYLKGMLVGLVGLVAGYLIGIMSGLWLQYIGWIAVLLNMLAYLAIIGMLSVDITLLCEQFF